MVLNQEQKDRIKLWAMEQLRNGYTVYSIDQFGDAEEVYQLNDHELFWQDAERYLGDLVSEYKYKN